jgi:hypothetical protein
VHDSVCITLLEQYLKALDHSSALQAASWTHEDQEN